MKFIEQLKPELTMHDNDQGDLVRLMRPVKALRLALRFPLLNARVQNCLKAVGPHLHVDGSLAHGRWAGLDLRLPQAQHDVRG